jgi:multiple sugar transport system permease protein
MKTGSPTIRRCALKKDTRNGLVALAFLAPNLAGIQAIPTTLYDAGELDGANSTQRFWHITRPMLSPTTFFVLIISVINSFQAFTSIYVMTGGWPGEATQVLVFRIYEEAFVNTNYGYASAQATVLFAIVLVFTVFQFRSREKSVVYMA